MKTFREFILECELVEGIQPLPREKMLRKIDQKTQSAKEKNKMKDYFGTMGTKKGIPKLASQIKKMKTKLRTHDPVDSRFRELENRDRGEKK